MKKIRIMSILSVMIICLIISVAPIGAQVDILTDVAAQTESTKKTYFSISDKMLIYRKNNTKKSKEKVKRVGYTNNIINVKENASVSSKTLKTYGFNTKVEYFDFNNKWSLIKYSDGELGYVLTKHISNKKYNYQKYVIPHNDGFKSYMPNKAITSKSSPQYKLQNQYAYTGEYGIRQVDGRFCVAIGTFSNAKVGTYIDLILKNGTVIPCVISDFKADVHTDTTNKVTSHNGCVSEFIVDMNQLHITAKKMGNISYCTRKWNSPVKIIKVYEKNVFEGD